MRPLRKNLAFFAVKLFLLFSFASFSQKPIIIAHRGASAYAPENTISSFEKAIEMKALIIETDVHQTKDSVVVIMHDLSVDRTTYGKGMIKDLDILYVTRTQFERFDKDKLTKANDVYCVNKKLLAQGKKDLIVLHPLPRTGEIDPEIDELPQAKYFAQANYGVFIRMALLSLITNAK